MWIFLNDAFLSIVAPERGHKNLVVRARKEGDIERVFAGVTVTRTGDRDYLFRAMVSRQRVAAAISDRLLDTRYTNFKNSVREDSRHDAYQRVWSTMLGYQRQHDESRRVTVEQAERENFALFGDLGPTDRDNM